MNDIEWDDTESRERATQYLPHRLLVALEHYEQERTYGWCTFTDLLRVSEIPRLQLRALLYQFTSQHYIERRSSHGGRAFYRLVRCAAPEGI